MTETRVDAIQIRRGQTKQRERRQEGWITLLMCRRWGAEADGCHAGLDRHQHRRRPRHQPTRDRLFFLFQTDIKTYDERRKNLRLIATFSQRNFSIPVDDLFSTNFDVEIFSFPFSFHFLEQLQKKDSCPTFCCCLSARLWRRKHHRNHQAPSPVLVVTGRLVLYSSSTSVVGWLCASFPSGVAR